jgi:hypothetical protein
MRQLLAKVNTEDPYGNKHVLKVFESDSGEVNYSLTTSRGVGLAVSNMQCGWRGPHLPDNVYDYESPSVLMRNVIKAINGSTEKVIDSTNYLTKFKFKQNEKLERQRSKTN